MVGYVGEVGWFRGGMPGGDCHGEGGGAVVLANGGEARKAGAEARAAAGLLG